VSLSVDLQSYLQALSASGPVEVREPGRRLGVLPTISWEVRGSAERPLLHLWSEDLNLTRRVLAVSGESTDRIVLSVERFGSSKPNRLEFVRLAYAPDPRQLTREEFSSRLRGILLEQFPDEAIESLTASSDLEHSLSGNYVRGLLRRGFKYSAVLAVAGDESADTAEASLTFGLLWLSRARKAKPSAVINVLRLILPKGTGRIVAHRTAALDSNLQIELYELDPARETLEMLDPRTYGNIESWLIPQRDVEALLAKAGLACEPIVSQAPSNISLHPALASGEALMRHRGLPFARWADQRIYFGAGKKVKELNATTLPALRRFVRDLEKYRSSDSPETAHLLYRSQPERWLEWMVHQDVSRIDTSLDSRFVYSQVFASTAGHHGILDLLTVTRNGRLAIIELKTGEHIHLPIQAADYWLRIKRQLISGNISRYGYFPKVELQQLPPLVYLVAPALRFHPSTDELLKYISPELQVVRVGLAENWRNGLRVVIRQ
jgi:hypothetical protein